MSTGFIVAPPAAIMPTPARICNNGIIFFFISLFLFILLNLVRVSLFFPVFLLLLVKLRLELVPVFLGQRTSTAIASHQLFLKPDKCLVIDLLFPCQSFPASLQADKLALIPAFLFGHAR